MSTMIQLEKLDRTMILPMPTKLRPIFFGCRGQTIMRPGIPHDIKRAHCNRPAQEESLRYQVLYSLWVKSSSKTSEDVLVLAHPSSCVSCTQSYALRRRSSPTILSYCGQKYSYSHFGYEVPCSREFVHLTELLFFFLEYIHGLRATSTILGVTMILLAAQSSPAGGRLLEVAFHRLSLENYTQPHKDFPLGGRCQSVA